MHMIYFDSQKQAKLQEAMVRKNCTKQKAEHLRISVPEPDLKAEDCLPATVLRKEDCKFTMKTPCRQDHDREDDNS